MSTLDRSRFILATILSFFFGCPGAQADVSPDMALASHNQVRDKLNLGQYPDQPTPNPAIPRVFWDPELANAAAGYSQQCTWQHSSDRINTGENLYAATDPSADVQDAVDAWAGEHVDYDFNTGACRPGRQCGHYTQLVWQESLLIGCGQASCSPLRYPNGDVVADQASYVVCRYATAGNIQGNAPYDTEGIDADRLPVFTETDNVLSIPYLLTWSPSNLITPYRMQLTLTGTGPEILSLDSQKDTPFLDIQHGVIFDQHSGRIFVPNVDVLLDGQWSRRSGILSLIPNILNVQQFQLTHFQ